MNEIVSTLLLVGHMVITGMHSKQLGLIYSACRPFTKTNKKYRNYKKQEIQITFIKTVN